MSKTLKELIPPETLEYAEHAVALRDLMFFSRQQPTLIKLLLELEARVEKLERKEGRGWMKKK